MNYGRFMSPEVPLTYVSTVDWVGGAVVIDGEKHSVICGRKSWAGGGGEGGKWH